MTREITWDIETNGLLDNSTVDYTASPYRLKDSFKMHCIVVVDNTSHEIHCFYDGENFIFDGRTYRTEIEGNEYVLENYKPLEYTRHPLSDFRYWTKLIVNEDVTVIAHNQINFDLLACKARWGMDYTIEPDSWQGKSTNFVDTLVLSKTLHPDRLGGHSLDALSSKTGTRKIAFRKNILPEVDRFKHFYADMLYYNIYDCLSNYEVYKMLMKEKEGWKWDSAISLEKSVAEIITRQSHRGFHFDMDLAQRSLVELDALMKERAERVEPLLPKKRATQKFLDEHTPPKNQFKKNGDLSANLIKWVERNGGMFSDTKMSVTIFGKTHTLPLPAEPLVLTVDATIDDSTHIKEWLVSLGWHPSEWKEKDLTIDTYKRPLSPEKYAATVERYVEQTLASEFKEHRLKYLKTTAGALRDKLLYADRSKPVRVVTNPNFTVGLEKELCPDLHRISADFPYVKDVVEYLTYKHRRNSILGGGAEWGEEDMESGYLSNIRDDGRIATPADTCGAATSRMKHKVVANIPRVTTLYGHTMRALFGADENCFEVGYDFASLEARMEAHYCYRYEEAPREYCESLLKEKPNDVHSVLARKISAILGRPFERGIAKNCKYGISYGAQPAKVSKIIGADLSVGKQVFEAFWQAAFPLARLKEKLHYYWETTGQKKFIVGIDGRKIYTRSPHSILNSLFQSAGVICAKRAMVIHDRMLKEEGYVVDFFLNDWKNEAFAQQMISYHDEAQLEISKSLAKFRKFDTKEEAEAFRKEQNAIWSEVEESPKGGWYVAYSRVGELASMAVAQAGEYYKLNVPLQADYIIERTWGGCH